jgi:hypothetical protein
MGEFARPVVDIEAEATEKKKQAHADPEIAKCRPGYRTSSFAFGSLFICFLLTQSPTPSFVLIIAFDILYT